MEPRLDVRDLDPEHLLVGEEAAHAGPEAEAVLVAAVEGPGEAGGVTSLIPELSTELGAVLPDVNLGLEEGVRG